MDKTIIVVTDLGHFKAYRITQEQMESPRVTMIESYDSIEGHGKLVDKLSDIGKILPGCRERRGGNGFRRAS